MSAASTAMLIVVEGAEGAGKSTQLARLGAWLGGQGRRVVTTREPGGTAVGDEIRRILLSPDSEITPHTELLLFLASRAQLVEKVLRPALAAGAVVLLDRFFLSTYAYQGAGRGLADADVVTANRLATGGLVPDLTLLLRVSPELGLARAASRGGHDRMERAESEFHRRVAAAFDRFATDAWQAQHPECGPIVTIDATGTEPEVFGRVVQALDARWPGSFLP